MVKTSAHILFKVKGWMFWEYNEVSCLVSYIQIKNHEANKWHNMKALSFLFWRFNKSYDNYDTTVHFLRQIHNLYLTRMLLQCNYTCIHILLNAVAQNDCETPIYWTYVRLCLITQLYLIKHAIRDLFEHIFACGFWSCEVNV